MLAFGLGVLAAVVSGAALWLIIARRASFDALGRRYWGRS